jgi:hypothetical protein
MFFGHRSDTEAFHPTMETTMGNLTVKQIDNLAAEDKPETTDGDGLQLRIATDGTKELAGQIHARWQRRQYRLPELCGVVTADSDSGGARSNCCPFACTKGIVSVKVERRGESGTGPHHSQAKANENAPEPFDEWVQNC